MSTPEQPPTRASGDRGGDVPPRRTPFLQQKYGDMLRSMVLLTLLIGLAYGCSQLLQDEPQETPVTTIDYSSELRGADQIAPYDVLAPEGLSAQWRATSADVEREGSEVAWHLGFLNPDDRYVGLEQTNGELPLTVATLVEGRDPTDTVSAAGLEWEVFPGPEGADNALVHVDGDVTTVVNGSPPIDELVVFADSLQ